MTGPSDSNQETGSGALWAARHPSEYCYFVLGNEHIGEAEKLACSERGHLSENNYYQIVHVHSNR